MKNQIQTTQTNLIKKWYHHKGVIAVIILAFLAVGSVWLYYKVVPAPGNNEVVVHHKDTISTHSNAPEALPAASPFYNQPRADFVPHLAYSFSGNLSNPNDIFLQKFTVPSVSDVTIQTWSYGGGKNAKNQIIPAGGFDPVVTLFDPDGRFVDFNDEGNCPPARFDQSRCFDATLAAPQLAPGTYTFALTVSGNFAKKLTLSDGFTGQGNFDGRNHNFAADVVIESDKTPQ